MFSMFITMNGKVSRSYPSYPGQLLNPNYQNLNDVDRFSSLRASRTSINTISSNDFAPFQLELENKPMSNLASDLFSIYHSGTDSNVTLVLHT
jgi:hypothetical protein